LPWLVNIDLRDFIAITVATVFQIKSTSISSLLNAVGRLPQIPRQEGKTVLQYEQSAELSAATLS
jgi:hypothetical protein